MRTKRCGVETKAGTACKLPAESCPHHNRGGRPTKYRERYDEEVYKLCLLGATDEQIAGFFEVSVQTIHNWTEKHEGFLEARKRGKEEADTRVAESLYHRALGYEHDAVKIMSYEGDSWEHEYVKKYAPDTTAAIFWLKNRQPHLWRDRKEVGHSGKVDTGQDVHIYLPANGRDGVPDPVTNRMASVNGANGASGANGDGGS